MLDQIERDAAERLEAYVSRVVAEAPPLSPEQRDRLAMLLNGGSASYRQPPKITLERPEIIALREAEARLAKVRSGFSEALAVCQGCDLAEKVHYFQKDYGTGFHEFVPLTPDDAIKVARAYKRKIAAAEKALEQARAA